jgi:hypothetical protein
VIGRCPEDEDEAHHDTQADLLGAARQRNHRRAQLNAGHAIAQNLGHRSCHDDASNRAGHARGAPIEIKFRSV